MYFNFIILDLRYDDLFFIFKLCMFKLVLVVFIFFNFEDKFIVIVLLDLGR